MKEGNRWCVLLLLVLILLKPAAASSASLRLQSDTLLRSFERETTKDGKFKVIPVYEYLQADFRDLSGKEISFHLYGWGRSDLGDDRFFREDTDGELLYGYLEYNHALSNSNLKLGRQYVFDGVANESVDGVRLSNVTPYFNVSLYAGQPVALDSEQGRNGDSILGGRIAHRFRTLDEVGVSYKRVDNDDRLTEERLGIDVLLSLPAGISLYGFSSRNLETGGWGEHSYELNVQIGALYLRPYFQQFEYEDFFTTGVKSANPFRLLAQAGETLRAYGVDLNWRASESWDYGFKAKQWEYDTLSDSAQYVSVLCTRNWQGLTSAGGEFGYSDGDVDKAKFFLGRAFFYREGIGGLLPRGFITGDAVVARYNQEVGTTGKDRSLFFSLGVGTRFLNDTLVLKLSADYSSDPFFEHDLRGLLVVSFVFDR